MASLLSGGERERVNIRRGLGAGGDTTGPPAEVNGYGWGIEAPKSSAPPAKVAATSRQRPTAAPGSGGGSGSGGGGSGSGSGGGRGGGGGGGGGGVGRGGGREARASAIGGGAQVVPADDPLVVKSLTSQVCFVVFFPARSGPTPVHTGATSCCFLTAVKLKSILGFVAASLVSSIIHINTSSRDRNRRGF